MAFSCERANIGSSSLDRLAIHIDDFGNDIRDFCLALMEPN
jgi:hypothetical protein